MALTLLLVVPLGCATTTTRLDNIVMAYDETTAETISKLLLLNIARAHQNLPMHFTGVSSILATYKFTFSGGVGPAATGDYGWLPVPQLGASTEENPTVSIMPMQGEEFTQRLLTPFHEQKLTLLLRQGYDVDALLRLLGAEASGEQRHRVRWSPSQPTRRRRGLPSIPASGLPPLGNSGSTRPLRRAPALSAHLDGASRRCDAGGFSVDVQGLFAHL